MTGSTPITVRQLATPTEIDAYFRLAMAIFSPKAPPEAALGWRDDVLNSPDFDPTSIRGVFRGDDLLGGCILGNFTLRMGPARLRTVGVGGVCVCPEQRRRGAASALMRDVAAYARSRGHTLLLLDGIPGFYHRFGYVDVHDVAWHNFARGDALELPSNQHVVRPCSRSDAASLFDLYVRHYGSQSGGFAWSQETFAFRLRSASAQHGPWLALDPDGRPRGYLRMSSDYHGARATEVAADDWPTAVALLRFHAELVAGMSEVPERLFWPLPVDSPLALDLADHLPARVELGRYPNAEWMARPVSVARLLDSLAPVLAERWQRSCERRSLEFTLKIAGDVGGAFGVRLGPSGVELTESAGFGGTVHLSQEALTQLVFGFRSVDRIAGQPGQVIPSELLDVLGVLFPTGHFWLPLSDAF